ncbi:MAG: hypothetical protein M1831_004090 [Alyxoria varia]|nr:MAG: hypothetical protein M1831_004090 [Alyxoria varia]
MATPPRVVPCCISTITLANPTREDPRLELHEIWVDVLRGNATAISHIWGSSDDQIRSIRHHAAGAPPRATNEQGQDWQPSSLISALRKARHEPEYSVSTIAISVYIN